MKYSSDKDASKAVKQALRRGWSLRLGAKHARLVSPDGSKQVLISGSPSDSHAAANFKQDILRIERGNLDARASRKCTH